MIDLGFLTDTVANSADLAWAPIAYAACWVTGWAHDTLTRKETR